MSCEECMQKKAEEAHGKVTEILIGQKDGKFVMLFGNGTRYIPMQNLHYDIEVGDSIYKVPGEFTYYIYKNCRKDNPTIIKDTFTCKSCTGFLW